MQDYDALARNAIRVWMRSVLDEKGWSANEWAVAAGTSPTNITRLLGPGKSPLPNAVTLAKLATIARSQPSLICGMAVVERVPAIKERDNFCPNCGEDLRPPATRGQTGGRRKAGNDG